MSRPDDPGPGLAPGAAGGVTGITRACPNKSSRGRPADPRLVALDARLVAIVDELKPIGIRGVFYQCVARGLLEKNEKNVALVERRLLKLRREWRVPYSSISDPASDPEWYRSYDDVGEFAEDVADLYRRDYWRTADGWPIVVVEKEGLKGVLAPVTEGWGVPLFACGGQQSETLIYRIGSTIAARETPATVYVLSDFDAAGDCIYRTFRDGSKAAPGGISRFTAGVPVEVVKLGLTAEQVESWSLPTRPVKGSDRRSPRFVAENGDRAVELDALGPDRLRALVDGAIGRHMPPEVIERFKLVERSEREFIRSALAGPSPGKGGRS